ncbi:LPXTG cell wall anchor domain-containing protein [Leucobacter salsicius]|uniref:LPXTG cell wall anchor domain-containing protein n=1 Tax=Leucobacter salsicius TaxID=664638 RepID=UPI0012F90B1C|nr:LPXTG cell wall anchor domain-containing protein [Leucobacter salsicius]
MSARGGELIVLGDSARPVIKPPTPTVDATADTAGGVDNAAAAGATAGASSAAASQAAGSGSAANGAGSEGSPNGPEAAGLSATGAEGHSPAFAIVGLCLLLALAVGGAGLRRSRRQLSE